MTTDYYANVLKISLDVHYFFETTKNFRAKRLKGMHGNGNEKYLFITPSRVHEPPSATKGQITS